MSFKKIIVVIVVMLMLLSIYSNNFISSAEDSPAPKGGSGDGYSTKMSELLGNEWYSNDDSVTKITNPVETIINVVRVIGMCVAIVMLLVVAMKYMTSAGDKAEIKKSAIIYVVGALVLFGAVGLLSIISQFAGLIH